MPFIQQDGSASFSSIQSGLFFGYGQLYTNLKSVGALAKAKVDKNSSLAQNHSREIAALQARIAFLEKKINSLVKEV